MDSVADYNNNPGNLRPPKGVTYDGQIGVDDRGFAIFETPAAGRRALVNDVQIKMRRGLNTPESFIDRYAPAGEENPEDARENYKLHLAASLGLKSTSDPFPEDAAERLADAIYQFESGQRKPPEPTREAAEPTVEPEGTLEAKERSEIPGASEMGRLGAGIALGAAGLGTATAIETGKQVLPLLPNFAKFALGRELSPTQPSSRLSLQRYLNSQIAPNLRLPLSELERVTGGKKIRTMSEVQQALAAIQAVEEKKTAKPMVRMVPGRPGVFEETGRMTTSTIPGRPGVDLTPYERPAAGPVRQAAGRAALTAGETLRGVAPSMARVGIGGLGGVSAGMQGFDAYELAKKIEADRRKGIKHKTYFGLTPDQWRLASKSAASAGGALSIFPAGVTQGAGLVLQAPEMAVSTYEFLREAQKQYKRDLEEGGLPPMAPTMDINPYGQ